MGFIDDGFKPQYQIYNFAGVIGYDNKDRKGKLDL
jgi:hypothetical protein